MVWRIYDSKKFVYHFKYNKEYQYFSQKDKSPRKVKPSNMNKEWNQIVKDLKIWD